MSRPIRTDLVAGRPDPLQLPETAGGEARPIPSIREGVWVAWTALSIVYAVGSDLILAAIGFAGLELGLMMFAAALAWTALTPLTIRRARRWIYG